MIEMYKNLWAKNEKITNKWHPLIFHLIDASEVAQALWEQYLPVSSRQRFARMLQLDEDQASGAFVFWTSLHDLGKASPAFQGQVPEQKARLLLEGIPFPAHLDPKPHSLITTWALESAFSRELKPIWRILAGHHGRLPTPTEVAAPDRFDQLGQDVIWAEMRRQLIAELATYIQPPDIHRLPEDPAEKNALLLLLLGFVVVADWLSSNESQFTFESPDMLLSDYIPISKSRAYKSLHDFGFTGWHASGHTASFQSMFAHKQILKPNAIQQKVIEEAATIQPPALVILEAPTGIGKTEAALFLADGWLQTMLGRGLYIAMPTTATSNQMFDRTRQFLQYRYPDVQVNLQLAHSQAILADNLFNYTLSQIGEDKGNVGRVTAMTWFQPRKKTLLAPFGVGTVDQTFLGVLQTRHFFLRLFGLESKVIIFDEVHAYDTYMNVIFERLLGWLRAVGSSVIILSATLPDVTRCRLVTAYTGDEYISDAQPPSYPRLTVSSSLGIQVHSLPVTNEMKRTLPIIWLEPGEEQIVDFLQNKLVEGGCAAVICNTVKRAQDVYQTIRRAGIVPLEECILFHARYPFAWRQEIENKVLNRFTRGGTRPERAIVVATQVIEQSLDLDFDLMVSDLAPIDLIIQRAGRLHRHDRANRPDRVAQPLIGLTQPAMQVSGDPDFGPSEFVYEPYYLDRTYLVLRGRDNINLPEETSELIEAVYGDNCISTATDEETTRLERKHLEMVRNNQKLVAEARNRLILAATDEQFLREGTEEVMEEDNPNVHRSFQALTRAASPGIALVCLHRLPDGRLCFDLQSPEDRWEPNREITPTITRQLLRCVIQMQRGDLVAYFASQPLPTSWQKSAALRYHRLAVFDNGICPIEGKSIALRMDRELGLFVQKEVK